MRASGIDVLRKKSNKCPDCGMRFTNQGFPGHMKTHAQNGHRPPLKIMAADIPAVSVIPVDGEEGKEYVFLQVDRPTFERILQQNLAGFFEMTAKQKNG